MNADAKLINNAMNIAVLAHNGQLRKYSNLPYIVHPVEVSLVVQSVTSDPVIIAGALLHDVLEDGPGNGWKRSVLVERILGLCGDEVFQIVDDLTDRFTHEDYPTHNRATRKKMERMRLGRIQDKSKTVKIADCLCNHRSIIENDEGFAKVFMDEISLLNSELIGGNILLWLRLNHHIMEYKK